MIVIETERLTLRHFNGDDAGFILDLLNQPSFLRFIGDRGVRTLADARAYIDSGPIESYRRNGFGLYAVEMKDTGEVIGMCGVMRKDWLPHPDLAYAFLPRFWSQGYAREAAAAVLTEMRATWRLQRIVAVVTPDNSPSLRLLEKLGFTYLEMVVAPDDGAQLSMLASNVSTAPGPQISVLASNEVPKIVDVLTEAFHDYPVMHYVLGTTGSDYDGRLNRLVHLFVMARALRNDPMIGIYAGSELSAAATMSYPDGSAGPASFARLREEIWNELGPDARKRYEQCVAVWETFSLAVPQLHVNMIGVRRAVQRTGLSRLLLDHVHRLSRTSTASNGVSLTTENPANVTLYEHFGYQVVGHARVAPGLETWGFFRPD